MGSSGRARRTSRGCGRRGTGRRWRSSTRWATRRSSRSSAGRWREEYGDSSGSEERNEEEDEEGDEDSSGDDASGGARWYERFRYYAVQEVQPIGEIFWEHACDDEEEAYQAYFAQVAENYATYGVPQSVLLLDCRERRVLSATGSVNDVNAAYEVRRWLGTG